AEAVGAVRAYDSDAILAVLGADAMRLGCALGTHYPADSIGGSVIGFAVVGIADLLERVSVPTHIQRDEVDYVRKTTGVGDNELQLHRSGDIVSVGSIDIELIHTPGHTPGSQCFLVANHLVAGDTLFLDG